MVFSSVANDELVESGSDMFGSYLEEDEKPLEDFRVTLCFFFRGFFIKFWQVPSWSHNRKPRLCVVVGLGLIIYVGMCLRVHMSLCM